MGNAAPTGGKIKLCPREPGKYMKVMPGFQASLFNMATGGTSAPASSTEEDATELQFPKGLN